MSGDTGSAIMNGDSGDEVEDVQSSPDASPNSKLKAAMAMRDPKVLAAMEDQLNGLSIDPVAFVRGLPAPVKRRLKALKKIQFEHVKIESKFYEEIHNIEAKYMAKYQTLYERRANIINGEVEPTDSECEWESDEEDEDDEDAPAPPAASGDENVKGMPEFWLTVMKHISDLGELIHDHDEAILTHLTDIKCTLSQPGEPLGYVLHFHFSPNDYFTNNVLTKKYTMKVEPDENEILYEGPEIKSCEGCTIEWKQGKNVTVKTIKKKQKHKKSGVHRTVTKQVPNESFFNFFTPIPLEEQAEPASEEIEATLQSDFEIGHFIREQVIPRAVLYFTGDAVEDDSDVDFDEDEDDEDEDDDDDEMAGGALTNGGPGEKPECKQQ